MSYNSLSYFQLNLKTLTPSDKFVMRAFVNEPNYTDLYAAVVKAQALKAQGRTYCYKFVPEEPGLYPKVYEQNDLIDLAFISAIVPDPYTYDFEKPFYINGHWIKVDAVDRAFIITYKGQQFYGNLYGALELAMEFRQTGRYYCYYMLTPAWFPEDQQFNVGIPGQKLILLFYNKDYIINQPKEELLEMYNK